MSGRAKPGTALVGVRLPDREEERKMLPLCADQERLTEGEMARLEEPYVPRTPGGFA